MVKKINSPWFRHGEFFINRLVTRVEEGLLIKSMALMAASVAFKGAVRVIMGIFGACRLHSFAPLVYLLPDYWLYKLSQGFCLLKFPMKPIDYIMLLLAFILLIRFLLIFS